MISLGKDLTLPLEAVTQTFAILGKRGSGKTTTARLLTEQLLDSGLPIAVVDPTGVWWGLRTSADGKAAGFPVVIFGGEHADVPLEKTAGKLIADVIVTRRISAVLDLSLLSKTAGQQFTADFLEQLYLKNRQPLHVVVDEADLMAPQRAMHGTERVLGAMESLCRRGRVRGLGFTVITQRPATLHKDILGQAEVLITMRMTGPRDVAAINEWVQLHADEDEAKTVKASLPSLPVGTAWFWSPGWLGILKKVAVNRPVTFDSSATPKAGDKPPKPQQMAPVDLAALGEQINATIEQTKANDPRELHRKIAALQRQLDTDKPAEVEERIVEVPVLADHTVATLESIAGAWLDVSQQQAALAQTLLDRLEQLNLQQPSKQMSKSLAPTATLTASKVTTGTLSAKVSGPVSDVEKRYGADVIDPRVREERDAARLKAGARRILETLARHHPMRVTKSQLGTLAKFKITGGTFGTYWGQLKRGGYVDEFGGDIGITQAGLDYIGVTPSQPLTTAELLEQWRGTLRAGARQMLDALVEVYPDALRRDDLAAAVGMAPTGGTFGTYLGTLRRNGLITVEDGLVAASSTLFLAERAS